MRFPAALANAQERIRRPGTWGAVILFGLVWDLLRWGAMPLGWDPDGLLLPFLLGAALLTLAPLPWQWSGDERPKAPLARGLLQALLLNAVLVGLVLYLLPVEDHPMMGRGMMHMRPGPRPLPPWQVRLWILGLASMLFGILLGRVLADRDAERHRAEEAELRAREAQTRSLQAQLNPHVLFNTISGLAELLRRLLDHAGRMVAPLSQERDLVEGLLTLEQFRLGDRLKVRWVWDASLEHLPVPPLLLQPLVENAIKHGIAPHRAGGELEIGLAGTPDELRLWVANTGAPLKEGSSEGIGLSNLRQRLALMRGEPGQLQLAAAEGRTVAELRFKPPTL